MASASPRSQVAAWTGRPCTASSPRTRAMPSAPRAQTETPAAACANASAIERPIPRLPPATTTRRPVKSNAIAVPFVENWRRAPSGWEPRAYAGRCRYDNVHARRGRERARRRRDDLARPGHSRQESQQRHAGDRTAGAELSGPRFESDRARLPDGRGFRGAGDRERLRRRDPGMPHGEEMARPRARARARQALPARLVPALAPRHGRQFLEPAVRGSRPSVARAEAAAARHVRYPQLRQHRRGAGRGAGRRLADLRQRLPRAARTGVRPGLAERLEE